MSKNYTAYTDGGCAWNPGGPGAAASIIIDPDGKISQKVSSYQATTNNRMEMVAVIQAFELIPKGETVDLYSDSQYVLNSLSGKWRKNKNLDLWDQIYKVADGIHINLHWVQGHSGNLYNERCDQLCSLAMITPTLEDVGFVDQTIHGSNVMSGNSSSKVLEKKKSAMETYIKLPENYQERKLEFDSNTEYAKKWHVNKTCAASIFEFYTTDNHNFKSYMRLKTNGSDYWSRKNPDAILSDNPQKELIEQAVKDSIDNIRNQKAAIRWYARGLRLEDAIRKVLVDDEVSYNAAKSEYF